MGSFICSLAAAGLLQVALPVDTQQVSGRVVRPGVRSMEPVGGVWVVLHRVGPDRSGPLDSLRSDAQGRYRFRYLRTGSDDAVYFVSAMHGGVAYFTPPLTERRVGGDAGEIAVFDTTSRLVPISIRGHHVVISAVDTRGLRSVVEVFEVSNDSSVTRIASSEKPEGATWRTSVLPAATNFRVTQGDVPSEAVAFANGVVTVFAPIAPGVKQLAFSYSLPATAFPIRMPVEGRTDVYEVLIEDETGTVTGPNIREVEPVSVEARNFRRFLAADVPLRSEAVIDLPRATGTDRVAIDPRFMVVITVVLGAAMVFALARALSRK